MRRLAGITLGLCVLCGPAASAAPAAPDTTKPVLTRLAAFSTTARIKVVYRLSEEAKLSVVIKRSGKRVKGLRVKALPAATDIYQYRFGTSLPEGRYTATAVATDLAGNTSSPKTVAFRVH